MRQFNSNQIILQRTQITNWFYNLVKMFPNREGQTQKGVKHTYPDVNWGIKVDVKIVGPSTF